MLNIDSVLRVETLLWVASSCYAYIYYIVFHLYDALILLLGMNSGTKVSLGIEEVLCLTLHQEKSEELSGSLLGAPELR